MLGYKKILRFPSSNVNEIIFVKGLIIKIVKTNSSRSTKQSPFYKIDKTEEEERYYDTS